VSTTKKSVTGRSFGLSLAEKSAAFNSQQKQCAICKDQIDDVTKAQTDHDHKTGKVRGLLCTRCNIGIGCFRDDTDILVRAIGYLRN